MEILLLLIPLCYCYFVCRNEMNKWNKEYEKFLKFIDDPIEYNNYISEINIPYSEKIIEIIHQTKRKFFDNYQLGKDLDGLIININFTIMNKQPIFNEESIVYWNNKTIKNNIVSCSLNSNKNIIALLFKNDDGDFVVECIGDKTHVMDYIRSTHFRCERLAYVLGQLGLILSSATIINVILSTLMKLYFS